MALQRIVQCCCQRAGAVRQHEGQLAGNPLRRRFGSKAEGSEGKDDKAKATFLSIVKGVLTNRVVLFGGGVVALITLNSSMDSRIEKYYKGEVYKRVQSGFCPVLEVDQECLPREEQRRRIRALLCPDTPSKFYYIVCGHRGNGKSTLIRQVCREVGCGVGYVAPEPVGQADFGRTLGRAINFNFEEHRNIFNGVLSLLAPGSKAQEDVPQLGALMRAVRALEEAAHEFRSRHDGRPFVLVVDDADRLAKDRPEALAALQEYAKEWADQQLVTMVFVASERATLKQMESQRAWSRAFEPVAVPGSSESEAVEYLRRRDVHSSHIKKLVEIASDDMQQLDKAALLLRRGMQLDDVCVRIMQSADQHYASAGLLDACPQQLPGLKVIEALLNTDKTPPSLPIALWRRLVPSQDMQEDLQQSNILATTGQEVKFASRVAEAYARHLLQHRLSPDVSFSAG